MAIARTIPIRRAPAYLHGGANIWQTPAVDPDLGLLYFSTGNPGPTAGGIGTNRPGDNLFSSSIVALHLDGTYAWHFSRCTTICGISIVRAP